MLFRALADENIPFACEALGTVAAEVRCAPRGGLTPADVARADVLWVRSVTPVGPELLEDARRLQFVGSATAGTDHVDRAFLRRRGIAFAHAPGSNAPSVADYVVAALLAVAARREEALRGKTAAVVGCGEVGSRVARRLEALAPHLPDGALVTDTGAAKQPIARHAAEVLPERASFVGGHPIASSERRGETEPDATRFDGGTYLLCPGEEASREAALATRQLREHHPGFLALAEATGARVQVRSPAHHDRLCAAARDLPELLAAPLTDVISEAAEDAGDHETLLALTDPALRPLVWGRQAPSAERREELVAGEGSLLDALGRYVRALQQTRRHLATGDLDAALSLGDGGS
ncbi:MAG: hypothetical protein BRD52_03630 [Bacteroidetes bacterium SW_4_67_19]|nr:MAG: hypothetical protein BRD52_03630 [Bacteroidetes bacterium SW_4_67_19]